MPRGASTLLIERIDSKRKVATFYIKVRRVAKDLLGITIPKSVAKAIGLELHKKVYVKLKVVEGEE